jgi:solute carrier family 25 phosphate transporter 23/24/25/41
MSVPISMPSHILNGGAGAKQAGLRNQSNWEQEIGRLPASADQYVNEEACSRAVVDNNTINIIAEEDQSVSGREEIEETLKLLLAGGVAGAVSKTATAPLARLTILYQVQSISSMSQTTLPLNTNVWSALRHIVRNEGFRSLWKGNGVTIIHRIPYSATNFWTYEKINEWWKEYIPSQGPLAFGDVSRRLVAGGTAGMVACSTSYPLDLVRTRLAAQTSHTYYRGITHALSSIIKEEGFRGLYRGLGATLIQVAPSLAINYAAYETTRSVWLAAKNEHAPSVGMSLACGSIAGLISSTTTFPLDLVRRRLQLQGHTRSSKVYGSYVGAFSDIVKNEGWKGLYSGILPEYYKVIPGVAIAFCTYEIMKRSLHVQTNKESR